MSQPAIDLFRTSCGAVAPLELNVSGPGRVEGERRIFDYPFVVIGRHQQSDLRLEDGDISRRHAYLQQIGASVFCVDLGSRTGIRWEGEPRPTGWLQPDQNIQIGPFTLALPRIAQAENGVANPRLQADGDPLQDRVADSPLQSRITVEGEGRVLSRFSMNRMLVLVGSSPDCRLRLRGAGVSKYHCSLLKTPQGIWLIDLLSEQGTFLNGQSLRCSLVKDGDQLQVGPYVLRVRNSEAGTVTTFSSPVRSLAEISIAPAEDPAEREQARAMQQEVETLRQQLTESQADGERLREQVQLLENQVAERTSLQARLEAAQVSREELEGTRRERDNLESEIQNLQTRLASGAAEAEERRQRMDSLEQELAKERETASAATLRLEQESATLESVRAELAARHADHDAATQRLQESQEELTRSQHAARGLQDQLDQSLEGQREIESLRQQLEDIRAEHTQLGSRLPELENRANAAESLESRLQEAKEEMERLQTQVRAAQSQGMELESARAEGDRLRQQFQTLEAQIAEGTGLQAQLEAAQASRSELERERDSWQTEVRNLQARLASESANPEQLSSQQSTEQALARVSELERALREAAATHEKGLEEARAEWHLERQALEARLAAQGQGQSGAIQVMVREIQIKAAAERERWRELLEGAESQVRWERGMFQEQSEQLRQQVANLQTERDSLASRLAQVELLLREAVAPQNPSNEAFAQFSGARSENQPSQTSRTENHETQAEQRRLNAIAQEFQAAWGEPVPSPEQRRALGNLAGHGEHQMAEVKLDTDNEQASNSSVPLATPVEMEDTISPSDVRGDATATLEKMQFAHDLFPRESSGPGPRKSRWRRILGSLLGK